MSLSENAYTLRILGDSMEPTIPDKAVCFVEPDAEPMHNKIVVVRLAEDSGETCHRLVIEDGKATLRQDNPEYPVMEMPEGAVITGVVHSIAIELD